MGDFVDGKEHFDRALAIYDPAERRPPNTLQSEHPDKNRPARIGGERIKAMERDPAAASAEYGGEFRRDLEGFVSIEAVTACVSRGVYERAPQRGVIYSAFQNRAAVQ